MIREELKEKLRSLNVITSKNKVNHRYPEILVGEHAYLLDIVLEYTKLVPGPNTLTNRIKAIKDDVMSIQRLPLLEQLKAVNIIMLDGSINCNTPKMLAVNYNYLYQPILDATPFIPLDRPHALREKILAIKKVLVDIPKCPTCHDIASFDPATGGYHEFCWRRECFETIRLQRVRDTQCSLYGSKGTFGNPEVIAKSRQTMVERYGVEYTNQSEELLAKVRKTTKERYGNENHNRRHISEDVLNLLENKDWLYNKHHVQHLNLEEIANELKVSGCVISNRFKKYNIPVVNFYSSKGEKEVIQFLEYNQINVIPRSRSIISPNELDIFLPDFNLAIEYCGLYWHSENEKPINYHKEKYDKCKAKGIRLITIFEDEWLHKRQRIEQIILNELMVSDNYTYDKCDVKLVTKTEKSKYFKTNNIFGDCLTTINIGLYHDNELVSCMGINKLAGNIYKIVTYVETWRTINGVSKLLEYLEENYNPVKILMDIDLRWEDSIKFEECGFMFKEKLDPDYTYIIPNNKRRHNARFSKNKITSKKIKKVLGNKYNNELTEPENMIKNGIFRIFDCGSQRLIKHGN